MLGIKEADGDFLESRSMLMGRLVLGKAETPETAESDGLDSNVGEEDMSDPENSEIYPPVSRSISYTGKLDRSAFLGRET